MVKTMKLGSTDVTIGRVVHGLMMMTWRDPNFPLPDEEAFATIKSGIDAMPAGVKMMLNSGEFYGPNGSSANLELLARFFKKYPDYASKTFLSVKPYPMLSAGWQGGNVAGGMTPDGSPENLRRSVMFINEKLGGIKKMDLFESARIPQNVSLEDMMKTLVELKKEGHFQYIGLSECSASSLRKAHAVHPITIVEIEVNSWSYEEETKKAGDMRRSLSRFEEENFKHNMALVDSVKVIADKKGVTPAQLAIAWVISRGPHVVPMPGSSNKKRNLENIAAGDIVLNQADLAEIDEVLAKTPIKGGRYTDSQDTTKLHLWG
ncbi:hypothetical protein GSI_03847 [Ganoderma sinense ZZ0214-1]|uniref:NADP-dependent oxidoreductase domain-containing protein n=1 Tax=Ganoderma sinense ZZ0214-1 TaxID=1077348 RepID=A0A2G8SK46_9APHY|nr:hypothetical protein GSI_03847 [Ganoderma sinense ZZ0214-1]